MHFGNVIFRRNLQLYLKFVKDTSFFFLFFFLQETSQLWMFNRDWHLIWKLRALLGPV